jgi:hypothetical protein
MMEAVLYTRISRPFGETTARALETIAAVMSDEENLWLPVSRFEGNYGPEIDRLVAAGLLTYSTDRASCALFFGALFTTSAKGTEVHIAVKFRSFGQTRTCGSTSGFL